MTLSYEERRALAYNWLLPWIECHKSLDGCVVVDFGSGEGAYTLPVADHAERVIAVDIDAAVIDKARENVRGAMADNVAVSAGTFERLLELVVSQAEGGVDVFLLIATLEHMTVPERLAVLGLARDTLNPDGLLVIWETPNRLLWSDHHTARMPFFHLLPDELALAWLRRVPRADFVDAVRERGPLELWRWGRGASFHELELGFGDLTGRVVAGGYDPATIGLRSVHRDELNLARYLQRELPSVHPAFSRYWLDLIVRRTPLRRACGDRGPSKQSTVKALALAGGRSCTSYVPAHGYACTWHSQPRVCSSALRSAPMTSRSSSAMSSGSPSVSCGSAVGEARGRSTRS